MELNQAQYKNYPGKQLYTQDPSFVVILDTMNGASERQYPTQAKILSVSGETRESNQSLYCSFKGRKIRIMFRKAVTPLNLKLGLFLNPL